MTDTDTDTDTIAQIDVRPLDVHGYRFERLTTHRGLSRESTAYSANLVFRGQKVGTVRNSGHGGESIASVLDHQVIMDAPSGMTWSWGGDEFSDMTVEAAILSQAEIAQHLGSRPGIVGVVLDEDPSHLTSSDEYTYVPVSVGTKSRADVLSAVESAMHLVGANSAIFPLRGVLHVATI